MDGIVDKIEIFYYEGLNLMGLKVLFGFLFEFWIRLWCMFVDEILMVLFYKLFISLDFNVDGFFIFFLIINRESKLFCSMDVVVDDIYRVKVLVFYYIVVIGIVGSLLMIMVNGEVVC